MYWIACDCMGWVYLIKWPGSIAVTSHEYMKEGKIGTQRKVHHSTTVVQCLDLKTTPCYWQARKLVCIHGNLRGWCKTKCPEQRNGLSNSMLTSSVLTLYAFHNSSFRLSWPSCPRSRRQRLQNRWLASRRRRASWMLKYRSGMTVAMTSLCWLSRCAWSWWRWQTSPGEFGRSAYTQSLFSSPANDGPFFNCNSFLPPENTCMNGF